MHDTAVGSANFTGCVPAPGARDGLVSNRGERWAMSQSSRCSGVHKSSAAGLRWDETYER
jgi:hypothetical protein